MLTRDKTEWEKHLRELWDKEVRTTAVKHTHANFHFFILIHILFVVSNVFFSFSDREADSEEEESGRV